MDSPNPPSPPRPAPSLRRALAWSAGGFVTLLAASIAACSGAGNATAADGVVAERRDNAPEVEATTAGVAPAGQR